MKSLFNLIERFEKDDCMAISTYTSNGVYIGFLGDDGEACLCRLIAPRASGLSVREGHIAVGTDKAINIYSLDEIISNAELARVKSIAGKINTCMEIEVAPKKIVNTGKILCHELVMTEERVLYVCNTRLSTITRIKGSEKDESYWKPAFINNIEPKDFCHLNGLCMVDGRVKYVTALAGTAFERGWRMLPYNAGILIDADENKIVETELAVPHSPRMAKGKLYLLESGTCTLTRLDYHGRKNRAVVELPGFGRGLAIKDDKGYVGLSEIRNSNLWNALPVKSKCENLGATIVSICLSEMKTIEYYKIGDQDKEVFDVQIFKYTRKNP
jgi:uncharacterized protein (TIGR03032 family)